MKKPAFSYIELIICMSLVTAVVLLTMPLTTQKTKTSSNIYGEFRCFSEYDDVTDTYRLYQQQRFNSSALSQKRDVTQTGCIFTRPTGVNSFTITAVGGGGGGSMPVVPRDAVSDVNQVVDIQKEGSAKEQLNSATLPSLSQKYGSSVSNNIRHCNNYFCSYKSGQFEVDVASYMLKKMQRAIALYYGAGGKQGQIVTKSSSLANNFVQDELVINFCRNTEIPTDASEYDYCVGKGGMGGYGEDLNNYYSLLGIIQDLIYSKKHPTDTYMGYGDGHINSYDLSLLRSIIKSPVDPVIINMVNYGLQDTPHNYDRLLNELRNISNNKDRLNLNIYNSSGYNGQYSRFKIDNNENIVAYGGKGGSVDFPMEHIFKDSDNENHVIDGDFYTRKGENGYFDNKFDGGAGGIGGNCVCKNSSCVNCDGLAGTKIGSGGGGGSIVFRTSQNLGEHKVLSFFLQDGTQLNSAYNLQNNSTPIQKLNKTSYTTYISNNKFYAGNGGAGAGGAIIINW
ncbi:MAG: hypothetical protein IJB79_03945 [Candidatus Gastranaerophilales bacterium]|nr:hypothetical protein [Candidatus Gastranaerophilales bacterium]